MPPMWRRCVIYVGIVSANDVPDKLARPVSILQRLNLWMHRSLAGFTDGVKVYPWSHYDAESCRLTGGNQRQQCGRHAYLEKAENRPRPKAGSIAFDPVNHVFDLAKSRQCLQDGLKLNNHQKLPWARIGCSVTVRGLHFTTEEILWALLFYVPYLLYGFAGNVIFLFWENGRKRERCFLVKLLAFIGLYVKRLYKMPKERGATSALHGTKSGRSWTTVQNA